VRAQGVVVELDAASLDALKEPLRARLEAQIAELFRAGGQARSVRFALYRVGSAFLHGASASLSSAEHAGNPFSPGEAG
jgi:uncharacterized protein